MQYGTSFDVISKQYKLNAALQQFEHKNNFKRFVDYTWCVDSFGHEFEEKCNCELSC